MKNSGFVLTVNVENMDDALDIYCSILSRKTRRKAKLKLALNIEHEIKIISEDEIDGGEKPALHDV